MWLQGIQSHAFFCQLRQERRRVRCLIIAQQPFAEVRPQARFPYLPVAIDGRISLVCQNPRHVDRIDKIDNGDDVLRFAALILGIHCLHEASAGIYNLGWRIFPPRCLFAEITCYTFPHKRAIDDAEFPITHIPLATPKNDAAVLLSTPHPFIPSSPADGCSNCNDCKKQKLEAETDANVGRKGSPLLFFNPLLQPG